jgi:Fe-S cluster assembly ATP-binding protein
MIQVKNLTVSVDKKVILSNIDFSLKPGQVTYLMGPNGSGKSTLALSLTGYPHYQVTAGKIFLDKQDITKFTPDKRANLGLFLSNQSPPAIPGLTVKTFLWQIYKKFHPRQKILLSQFRQFIESEAAKLKLNPDLFNRGLNDGFSGGERKKMELLQLLVSQPRYLILDEIDSGLDVDAVKIIFAKVKKLISENNLGVLVITHSDRISKYLPPDHVLILSQGSIVASGSDKLIAQIESQGFDK